MSRSLFFVEVEDQSKLWYEVVNITHHDNLGLPLTQKPRGVTGAKELGGRRSEWQNASVNRKVSNANVEKNKCA